MKHNMKRIAALLAAVALLLTLGACAPLENIMGKITSGGWKDDKPYESYKLDKYITLGEYKGVEAEFLTDEGYIDLYVEDIFAQYGARKGIADDPAKTAVADGDLVAGFDAIDPTLIGWFHLN